MPWTSSSPALSSEILHSRSPRWSWAAFAAVLAANGRSQQGNGVYAAEVAAAIRGVSPADQAKYTSDGSQTFRCLNGAATESTAQLHLPLTAVNDDFCDCADGSDEPGTSACAGQKETLFYCVNEHSAATFIYTSRVNDGICDCCDGSDEWSRHRPSHCQNTCEEEGQKLRQELKLREAAWKKGADKRLKLIEAARVNLEQARKDLVKLQTEIPGLEAAENTTAAAAKVAQAAWNIEKKRAERKRAEANKTTIEASASVATKEESAPPLGASSAAGTEDSSTTTPLPPDAEKTEQHSEEGEPVISEYTKWMDGADKALGKTGTVSKAAAVVEEEDPADDLDDDIRQAATVDDADLEDESVLETTKDDKGFGSKVWKALGRAWEAVFGKGRSPLEIARDKADEAHKDAKKKLEDAQKQLKALGKKVNANHTDEQLAFSALEGQCITKKLAEYKYEVCFFNKAKQDSVSIGDWERWEGSNVALFDNGQYCPGGPSRSLRIHFECGDKEEILDVTEPSRCTYKASMSHPGACSGPLPSEAQQGRIQMPTDEL